MIRRLPQEVASEELAGADLLFVEMADEVAAGELCRGTHRKREAEPAGVRAGRRGGEDKHVLQRLEARAKPGEVAAAGGDEAVELVELGHAHGRLHVGELQVVADVGIDVFVVVAVRQVAELPVEPLAAGVVVPRLAPAVAAPVAEALHELFELRRIGEHDAPLAHRHVVRGIETARRHVAELADVPAAEGRPERVAAVFHEPQVVPLAEVGDRGTVERITERMGEHHRPRLVALGRLEAIHVDVIGGLCFWMLDVNEHGHAVVLQDRVDRRRETRGHGDHLVAGLQGLGQEFVRREGRQGEQIRTRPGVHEARATHAHASGESFFKFLGEPPRGEPEVERTIDEVFDLRGIEHAARHRHGLPRLERPLGKRQPAILCDKRANLVTNGVGRATAIGSHARFIPIHEWLYLNGR